MNPGLMRHGAVILAAGASTRLGRSKQALLIDNEPLLRRATRAALATHPVKLAVVLGAAADATIAMIADLAVERVHCPNWADGMGASLRVGVLAVQPSCDGLLVVLCDQPALTAAHLERLVAAWLVTPEKAIASSYAHTLGAPAIFPRSWFPELLKIDGDNGARNLLRSRPEQVVDIPAPELSIDIDTPQDIKAQGFDAN